MFAGDSTSDSPNPLHVTEIATELVITRLFLIDLLQQEKISTEDTIITTKERTCLYTKIFKNVTYRPVSGASYEPSIEDEIVDLLDPVLFDQMAGGEVWDRIIPYLPFYRNWERDKELIESVEWSNLDKYSMVTNKPFVAVVIRKRAAWTDKNMTDQFWLDFLSKLKGNGIPVCVFGKETEMFCDSKSIHYIENFQDWCTIVRHSNCKRVVSTMTGGVYPCLIFGNPDIKMTLIDNTNLKANHGYDPSFYNDCINFSRIQIDFIDHIPTTNELYEIVTNDL